MSSCFSISFPELETLLPPAFLLGIENLTWEDSFLRFGDLCTGYFSSSSYYRRLSAFAWGKGETYLTCVRGFMVQDILGPSQHPGRQVGGKNPTI